VARGNIEYSAVTQPLPEFRIHPGTPFSTVALHSTRVCPTSINTEPSAIATNPGVKRKIRASSDARPPLRNNSSVMLILTIIETHPDEAVLVTKTR